MSEQIDSAPVSNLVRESTTSLTALLVDNFCIIETLDWQGDRRADYTSIVDGQFWSFGHPFLDAAFIGSGSIQVRLQLGLPTDAAVDPPAVTFSTHLTFAAVANAWLVIQGYRIPSRHCRLQLVDTSNAINAAYGCVFVRGA